MWLIRQNAICFQIPDVKTKDEDEPIDAVVVDEDAVGSVDRPGSGAKILRGDGALERYITDSKIKDRPVLEGVEVESEGESEDASRALGLWITPNLPELCTM